MTKSISRKMTISNLEWIESSWRDLFIGTVVDRFIFKNNQITRFPAVLPSYLKQQLPTYLMHGFLLWNQILYGKKPR